MRRLFHKPSKTDPLVEVAADRLDEIRSGSGFFWLDLTGEPADQVRHIGELLRLEEGDIEESIDHTLIPTVEEHERHIFMATHGVLTGTGERLRTLELDYFLGDGFLVTVHASPVPAVSWFQEQIENLATVGLTSPAHLTAYLSQLANRRFTPLTDELEARIDDLEELAFQADPRTLTEVHALRRDVVVLRRTVGPQREVFRELAASEHYLLDDAAVRAFHHVYDQQVRIGDSIESARTMLNSVQETYRGAVADQTNEIVRLLTVFSATLLPLSLIAGIWGMNFNNLPASTARWGFWGLIGLMGLVGLGFWVYFARRGFVGQPRLRELPRSVGLGLVQIGVAPIKIVAGGIESTVRTVSKHLPTPGIGGPSEGDD